jgi:hypothetical protein
MDSIASFIEERAQGNLFLRWALYYALVLGWLVFPLRPKAKEPLTRHGFKDAALDAPQICEWWAECPNANIGIPTGVNFFVLDEDPRHGGDQTLSQLEHRHGALDRRTMQQITGRQDGGRHWLWQVPDRIVVPNYYRSGTGPGHQRPGRLHLLCAFDPPGNELGLCLGRFGIARETAHPSGSELAPDDDRRGEAQA